MSNAANIADFTATLTTLEKTVLQTMCYLLAEENYVGAVGEEIATNPSEIGALGSLCKKLDAADIGIEWDNGTGNYTKTVFTVDDDLQELLEETEGELPA